MVWKNTIDILKQVTRLKVEDVLSLISALKDVDLRQQRKKCF